MEASQPIEKVAAANTQGVDMRSSWVVIIALALAACSARAATITIVGVVAYQPTGEYRSGIDVGLYCDDIKTCKLGVKHTTTTDGQYKLTKSNINPTKLFVIYDGAEGYAADPVIVSINCPQGDEPCVIMAKKLLLRPFPAANNLRARAAYLNAFGHTQSVKALAGTITIEMANENTASEAAKILGLSTGIMDARAGDVLAETFKAIRALPTLKDVSQVNVLTNEAEIMKLPDHADFKKFREFKGDPSRLKNKEDLDDQLRYFLSLPPEAVKQEWVDNEKHLSIMLDYLKRMKIGDASLLQFKSMDTGKSPSEKLPLEGPKQVVVSIPAMEAQNPRVMFEKHSELRAWVFFETLLKEPAIPPTRKRQIADRIGEVRPVIVELRK